jgi:hypothetical protein
MSKQLKYALIAAAISVATSYTIICLATTKIVKNMKPSDFELPIEEELPSINNATSWLNSKPLKDTGLKGKVVLINFCTYTCINWLRRLPYVRSWEAKYKDQELVVIGVHTPEFSFEKNIDNVRRAIKDTHVDYPVVLDNDYEIWHAFKNEYWPALYFIDAQGHIRHRRFGEGSYEQSEKIIQLLLAESGANGINKELVSVNATGIEVAADFNSLQSNENYLGYERTQNFSSPGKVSVDKKHVFVAPEKLIVNQWSLAGEWTMTRQSVVLNNTNGRILYRFHARDLHLVMGPAMPGTSIKFRVLIDGQPPATAKGTDVDDQGYGIVTTQKLYQLIRQSKSIIDRLFEIEFFDAGVEAFSFTFG